ncbi:MAG: DUF5667 domain-containing protein [Patescibacteria group bacterium]|jgi:ribosomal protein S17E
MKLLKTFSLIIILIFASFVFTNVKAQTTNSEELANALLEFETDEINAKSFGIENPSALPGEFKYNWQLFKENINLFFTFKSEEKIAKLEEISNRRLIEAQKLSEIGTANAASRVEEALKRYEQAREKIAIRLEENPELKERLLEKFDANQLKHQQVLSTVTEKLRNKISQTDLEKLENIKHATALRWYNTNKENLQKRLEEAVDDNNVGSKFRQLKNIATLEELSNTLPEEARGKIEAARLRAEERLAEKLENIDNTDREKLEKYINNIKIPELTKQRFISNLKDSEKLPASIREKANNILNTYSNALRNRFQSLNEEEQKRFLNQFEDKLNSHPINLEFLKTLDTPENKDEIKNLLEIQTQGIKARIQATTDPAKLRILEQNIEDNPVLKRQIQQRQIEIKNN